MSPAKPIDDVTVAIVTRERPDSLCAVVADVVAGRHQPDEILIVCQGEGAVETAYRLAREIPEAASLVRFYASVRDGSNRNRNDAVRLANGQFIAYTDDDMRLPEDWLEAMLRHWEEDWHRGPVLLTGPIHAPDATSDPTATPGYRFGERRRVWHEPPRVGDVLYGGHFGVSRSALSRIESPPFDERFGPGSRFPGAGDEEFATRLLRAGVPIAFEPSIRANHVADPGTWIWSQYEHSIGIGAMYALRSSSGESGAVGVAVRNSLGILAKSSRNILRLNLREAVGRLAGVVGILQGAWSWSFSRANRAPRALEPGSDDLTRVPL